MSGYRDAAHLAAALALVGTASTSKHRTARIHRFVHRHPQAHRKIITQLRAQKRRQQRRATERFEKLQAQPADKKVRHTDPLPWTRRGQRLAKNRAAAKGGAQ